MINKVILLGRLGQNIQCRPANGTVVGNVALATTTRGGKEKKTEWHDLVFWGKAAETMQTYTKKGDTLYVEGEIKYKEFEKDGIKRTRTEIWVKDFNFLSQSPRGKKEETSGDYRPSHKDDSPLWGD